MPQLLLGHGQVHKILVVNVVKAEVPIELMGQDVWGKDRQYNLVAAASNMG
jgi:hypothetical protein